MPHGVPCSMCPSMTPARLTHSTWQAPAVSIACPGKTRLHVIVGCSGTLVAGLMWGAAGNDRRREGTWRAHSGRAGHEVAQK